MQAIPPKKTRQGARLRRAIRIVNLLREGKTPTEVALLVDVSPSTVYNADRYYSSVNGTKRILGGR